MKTLLVQEIENEEKVSIHDVKSPNVVSGTLDFIDREVDMGFFNHHSFKVIDGIVVNSGCQRIKKCSCNCNDCALLHG